MIRVSCESVGKWAGLHRHISNGGMYILAGGDGLIEGNIELLLVKAFGVEYMGHWLTWARADCTCDTFRTYFLELNCLSSSTCYSVSCVSG